MYCGWCLDHTSWWKLKFKNGLNSQKRSTVRRKLFEMFLKTIDWKLIWKFCVTIICGLHFARATIISYEKYYEKFYDHRYLELVQLLKMLKFWRGEEL